MVRNGVGLRELSARLRMRMEALVVLLVVSALETMKRWSLSPAGAPTKRGWERPEAMRVALRGMSAGEGREKAARSNAAAARGGRVIAGPPWSAVATGLSA